MPSFPSTPMAKITRGCISALCIGYLPMVMADSSIDTSGVLEVELSTGKDYNGNRNGDITLATASVAMDTVLSDHASAHVSLLYEEGETPLEIDEAYISARPRFPSAISFKVGQMYVPFGTFETMMISDPLTLEIGETRETTAMLQFEKGLTFSFYVFNGDLVDSGTGNDSIDNFGTTLGYSYQGKSASVKTLFGYINNIGESDGLSAAISGNITNGVINQYIGGVSAHVALTWRKFVFIGERVTARDYFAIGEIDPSRRSRPSASHLEASWAINDKLAIGLSLQQSHDTLALGLPQRRVLLGTSYVIDKSLRVKCELAADRDFATVDGGSGNSAHSLILQLASEF